MALAACSAFESDDSGQVSIVEGFLGGVAADEPRAVLIGRSILAAGGNAADAATAIGLTLTVTLPSSAGLAGGGVCLVHNPFAGKVEALDFLPAAPREVPASATRPSAVPTLPRGLYALHSRYGRQRWSQVVTPAEGIARFGAPVSRAFAADLAKVEAPLMADVAARRIFARSGSGGAVKEGDTLIQMDLSTVLSRLRTLGPGDFYSGSLARALVAAVQDAGGSLSLDDLRNYTPEWRPTVQRSFGYRVAHFAPASTVGGAVSANLWTALTSSDAYEDAPAAERPHLLAEAALRVFADRAQWLAPDGTTRLSADELATESRAVALMKGYRADRRTMPTELPSAPVEQPETPSATTFVVVDKDGQAVVCALTMNNLFGTGRVAPGSGMLLAASPQSVGRRPISLAPMMIVNPRVKSFYFGAAAAGGSAAPTATIEVALRALVDEQPLEDAMAAPRLHHAGAPDVVYHEPNVDAATLKSLADRQYRVATTPTIGLVNAIACPEGLPPNFQSCAVRSDPRGSGYAASAEQ